MPNSELIPPKRTLTSGFYRLHKCYYSLIFMCMCVFLGTFMGTRHLYVSEEARGHQIPGVIGTSDNLTWMLGA